MTKKSLPETLNTMDTTLDVVFGTFLIPIPVRSVSGTLPSFTLDSF